MMDSATQNLTQDNDTNKKKKSTKSKLSVLKYGLRRKSDSEKLSDKASSKETVSENHTKLNNKEDLHSSEVNSDTDRKSKKSRKEKKTPESKPNKPISFIKKLKLGKYTSSPLGTRRDDSKNLHTKPGSSNMSLPSISSTISEKRSTAALSEFTEDEKTSNISMADTCSVEGETTTLDKSTDSITTVKTTDQDVPATGNSGENTRRKSTGGEGSRKRHSKGDETVTTSQVQSLSNPADKASQVCEGAAASSSSDLQADENNTESRSDNESSGEKVSAAEAMPAFSDLIIDGSQESSQNTSNVTQFGQERKEHLYKLLVIGELGTGKTSIIKRYVHQFFSQHYRATIGVDFALKVLNWDANTIIRLQLWDIAGQERFGNMTRVYYKDAVGAFIVFDATRVATFDAVVKWKQDLDSKVQLPDGSPIPCVLLGNKCDQQKEGMVNMPSRMDEYCKEKGFAGWFETSAKENINIEEAAKFLVSKILLNDKLLCNKDANKDNERIAIDGKSGNNKYKTENIKSCSC